MWSIFALFCLFCAICAELVTHDASFVPDIVLEARHRKLNIACETRYSVVINGSSPGPTLHLNEGKSTWIRVYNQLENKNFTIHWHGLSQRTAPFSDGTPLVAQWPIPPGHFFDYEISPEVGDAGTYFYHSHVGFQQVSAHGALIVEGKAKSPFDYVAEKVLTFGNYFNKTDDVTESQLTASPIKWSGETKAITLQGQSGTAPFNKSTESSCQPYIIAVKPNKQYRLRVIGASALTIIKMAIEGHCNLTVIEADGRYTRPVTIDHIQVAPGQRFSFLLQTKSEKELKRLGKSQFWIRYESRDRPTLSAGYALLRYEVAKKLALPTQLPKTSPILLPNNTHDYLEHCLQPFASEDRQGFPKRSEVTRTVFLQMAIKVPPGSFVDGEFEATADWATNNVVWQEKIQATKGQIPYLIDLYLNDRTPNYTLALENKGHDPSSNTYPAKVGEVLDIVWLGNGGVTGFWDSHPMHMHGEHFWDLGSGNGTYNATKNDQRFGSVIPAKRDTTVLYKYNNAGIPNVNSGWRAWRIRVTEQNVGAWMSHCHIAQHAIMGMNVIWVFGDAEAIKEKFPSPPYIEGYLQYGGSAYGNHTHFPTVNRYFKTVDEG